MEMVELWRNGIDILKAKGKLCALSCSPLFKLDSSRYSGNHSRLALITGGGRQAIHTFIHTDVGRQEITKTTWRRNSHTRETNYETSETMRGWLCKQANNIKYSTAGAWKNESQRRLAADFYSSAALLACLPSCWSIQVLLPSRYVVYVEMVERYR